MKQHPYFLVGLAFALYASCKPDPITEPPLVASESLVIEASVPAKVWDNTARIYLDASRTNTLNGRRQLNYFWSLVKMPPGASVNTLRDVEKPLAWIDSPLVVGEYDIELLVEDRNDLQTRSSKLFRMEILPDTLHLYPPRADAGNDFTITAPDNSTTLSGLGTYYINPIGRRQTYAWTVVSQPSSTPSVTFQSPNLLVTMVSPLREGIYRFRLEVRDELGRTAGDTVQVTVLPDPLKGTVKLFNDLVWEKVQVPDDGWGWGPSTEVVLHLSDPTLSIKRDKLNTEVRVWIDSLNTWSAPNGYYWDIVQDGVMQVKYPYSEDEKIFLKDVGKKTRVEVRFR